MPAPRPFPFAFVLAASVTLAACGQPEPPPPATPDLAVLELRLRARENDLERIRERLRGNVRVNPARADDILAPAHEGLTGLRLAVDGVRAAGLEERDAAVAEFDRAHAAAVRALREAEARAASRETDPSSPSNP